MKKIKYTLGLIALMAFGGCSNIDEVPPKTNNLTTTYTLPKPSMLTADERAEINERTARYHEAVK